MSQSTQTSRGGISTSSLLGVAFVILKLTHVINWSWWWVLAPFWIPWAVIGVIFSLIGLAFLVDEMNKNRRRNKRVVARKRRGTNF